MVINMKTTEQPKEKLEGTNEKKGYEPASITIAVKDHGIVLKESSMLLADSQTSKILAIGNEAEQKMQDAEYSEGRIIALNPLRRGIIASYSVSVILFRHYIQKALECSTGTKKLLFAKLRKPRIIICVPEPLTEVETKAFQDCFYQAGAKEVMLTSRTFEEILTTLPEIPGHYNMVIGIKWTGTEA